MSTDQLRLIRLLQLTHDYVESWRALFQGAMIRATTARGRTATVAVDAIEAMVRAGLLAPGYGGSFVLTDEGRQI